MTKKELIAYIRKEYKYSYREEISYTPCGNAYNAKIHLESCRPEKCSYYEQVEFIIHLESKMFIKLVEGTPGFVEFKDFELIKLIEDANLHASDGAIRQIGE